MISDQCHRTRALLVLLQPLGRIFQSRLAHLTGLALDAESNMLSGFRSRNAVGSLCKVGCNEFAGLVYQIHCSRFLRRSSTLISGGLLSDLFSERGRPASDLDVLLPRRSFASSTERQLSLGASKPSASSPTPSVGANSIYVSLSDDPYFNLSLEDTSVASFFCPLSRKFTRNLTQRLFRKHDVQKPMLLIYRDSPCVVIGRNQNPWKEVNLKEANRISVPFIRRRSGGGTVYHVRVDFFRCYPPSSCFVVLVNEMAVQTLIFH